MLKRSAIQVSGIVVPARSSFAKATLPRSPLHPFRLGRGGFLHRLAEVAGPGSRAHLGQQFLAELLVAQIPAALHGLEFPRQVFPPPLFHPLAKHPPPSHAVLGNAPFPPSNRSTRSQSGRFPGAAKYQG